MSSNHSPRGGTKKPNKDITKKVSPPLSSTRLNRFIYTLVLLSTILVAFYSYRIYQWKTDAGGWWSLALYGKKPPPATAGAVHGEGANSGWRRSSGGNCKPQTVEESINALAESLGLPSRDLAIAIAAAVREYVPPASLSSIKEKETGGPAVEELLKAKEPGQTVEQPQTTGIIEDFMGSFVGMDEP